MKSIFQHINIKRKNRFDLWFLAPHKVGYCHVICCKEILTLIDFASVLIVWINTATDKVALLIGNQDYRSAKRLIAPELDVEKLAVVLSELDFKVISLLNLNLQEMNFALSAFCALLNSGVYGKDNSFFISRQVLEGKNRRGMFSGEWCISILYMLK